MDKTSRWLNGFKSGPNHTAQTISVTGGKGGVGKTSMALKMAQTFADKGKKVLLIDCDYNLSNTAIKLGLPINNQNIYGLVSGQKNFYQCITRYHGFDLLSACNGDLKLFDKQIIFEQLVIDMIEGHKEEYDYILLDCPAGIARESLVLNSLSDHRIFVVTPDKSSITDSYSLMKILKHRFNVNENHLLVNMYLNESQYLRVVKTLSETAENFLGTRTFVLGGLKRLDIEFTRFDKFLMSRENSSLQNNFLKMLKVFADRLPEQRNVSQDFSKKPLEEFMQDAGELS